MNWLVTSMVVTMLFSSVLSAQDQSKKVGGEFHVLYKHFMKKSLVKAIAEGDSSSTLGDSLANGVVPRLNGMRLNDAAAKPSSHAHELSATEIDSISRTEEFADIIKRCVYKTDIDGVALVRGMIKYNGDLDDLRQIGVHMSNLADSKYSQSTIFRLDLLPKIAALPGLEYIHAPTWMTEL